MTITREQALNLSPRDHVHYTGPHRSAHGPLEQPCMTVFGPRGGVTVKVIDCRVNGVVRTWVTRPTEFYVPIKYGLREHGSIQPRNAGSWHLASECQEIDPDTGRTARACTSCALCTWKSWLPGPEGCDNCGWTSSADSPHNYAGGCSGTPRDLGHQAMTLANGQRCPNSFPGGR